MSYIRGSGGGGGGGGKGGGAPRAAVEAPNTLQSSAQVRILDLWGEGPLFGLSTGDARSIKFDGTPITNADGTNNFGGVGWQTRLGLPVQDPMTGFSTAESEFSVNTNVTKTIGPVSRSISTPNLDAIRVTLQWQALAVQDTSNGDLNGGSVNVQIELSSGGGAFQIVFTDNVWGKTTSPYLRSYRIPVSGLPTPFIVRITRETADATTVNVQDAFSWLSYTEILEGNFTYPNSAYAGLNFNSAMFGAQIPQRTYRLKGLLLQIPTNYDPVTAIYTGIWDGTFKTAWCSNPAWIYYDLLTNTRYGLGKRIRPAQVEKFALYAIAQYCDGLVPDGLGGTERRYTFNAVIASRTDAWKVLQSVAAAFRGMAYFSTGSVYARADMPGSVVKNVNNTNVKNGKFTYSGTSKKARHTAVVVTWKDPSNNSADTFELYEDPAAIQRFGYNEVPGGVVAFGVRTRSGARRYGKWIIDTEQNQSDAVTYEASFDQIDVTPGDLISVSDAAYAQFRMGGRLASATLSSLTLDKAFTIVSGITYTVSVTYPNGTLDSRTIDVSGGPGSFTTLNLTVAMTQLPQVQSTYIITASNLSPRQFTVLRVRETGINNFEVTAAFFDPGKFARVETDISFDAPIYSALPVLVSPPPSVSATPVVRHNQSDLVKTLAVAWPPSPDPKVMAYEVAYVGPSRQAIYLPTTRNFSVDISPVVVGTYQVFVYAVSMDGRRSRPASATAIISTTVNSPGAPNVVEQEYVTNDGNGVKTRANLSWAVPGGQSFIDYYQPEFQLVGVTDWTPGPTTQNLTGVIDDIGPGLYDFRVRAVGSSGTVKISGSTRFEIHGLSAVPLDPTGFSIMPVSNMLLASFNASSDADVLIGGHGRLRYSPLFSGITWQYGFDVIGPKIPGSSTHATVPLLPGTYMFKWVDSSGNESANYASANTNAPQLFTFVSATSIVEAPTFSGTKTNCAVDGAGGFLHFDGITAIDSATDWDSIFDFDSNGGLQNFATYLFFSGLDLGSVKPCRLATSIDSLVVNTLDVFDSRPANVDDWVDWDGTTEASVSVTCFVRTTDTDPNASPVWSSWVPLMSGDFNHRGFQFKLEMSSTNAAFDIQIRSCTVNAIF